MAQKLTDADVHRIATLARLELAPGEVAEFARQLGDILTYADDIRAADTAGVEPMSHPFSTGAVWREDELIPSLDREALLGQAPTASPRAGLFKVPKVL